MVFSSTLTATGSMFGQSGSATQEITAAGGKVDMLTTNDDEMGLGPGVFALWNDASDYQCGSDSFTMMSWDEVESIDIAITFRRA